MALAAKRPLLKLVGNSVVALTCAYFVLTSHTLYGEEQNAVDFSKKHLSQYLEGEPIVDRLDVSPKSSERFIPQKSDAGQKLGKSLEELVLGLKAVSEENGLYWGYENTRELNDVDIELFRKKYDKFIADHTLYLGKLKKTNTELDKNVSASEFTEKLNSHEKRYLAKVKPFIDALSRAISSKTPSNRTPFEASVDELMMLSSVEELIDLLEKPPRGILRSQSLPVKSTDLANQALNTSNITPTYAATTYISPIQADTAPTAEAPFSDAIRTLAAELDHNPVRIYQYVLNEIHTEFYSGSMKGAENTLSQKAGNSVDQSSLLIALLRASNIPARYVTGNVLLPLDLLENQLGLSGSSRVADALQKAGINYVPIIQGGSIRSFRTQQTWVSASVPYANYRGAVVDTSGQSWIGLMPFIKTVNRTPLSASINELGDGYLNALEQQFLSSVQNTSPLQVLEQKLVDKHRLDQAEFVLDKVLEQASIQGQAIEYLPNTFPFTISNVISESNELGQSSQHWIDIAVYSGTSTTSQVVLKKRIPLSSLENQRVTLSYMPGSIESQNVVNSFGGLGEVPAYLVELRPQIKVNGELVAVGEEVLPMGARHLISVQASSAKYSTEVTKEVVSGSYHAIAIAAQSVFNDGDDAETASDTEFTAARILSQMGLRYLDAWFKADQKLASLSGLRLLRPQPSIVFITSNIEVDELLGQPQQLNWQGVHIDAALHNTHAVLVSNDSIGEANWRKFAALHGSYLEHSILRDDFGVLGVSADKILAAGVANGISTERLDSNNIDSKLALLGAHDTSVLEDIQQWVQQGYTVEIPTVPVAVDSWLGSAWVVRDPQTGASGYFLSGGLAGGASSIMPGEWPSALLVPLIAPYVGYSNTDGLAGTVVHILPASDNQIGTVATQSKPMEVVVLDDAGLRVEGAPVTFSITQGGGYFNPEGDILATSITTLTNVQGVATAELIYPDSTETNRQFLMLDPSDAYATQVAGVHVDVLVKNHGSDANDENSGIRPPQPFTLYAKPGIGIQFYNEQSGKSDLSASGLSEGHIADTFSLVVMDEFDNPVSNAPITVTVGAAQALDSGSTITQQALLVGAIERKACADKFVSRACGLSSIHFMSSPYGTNVTPLMGSSSEGNSGSRNFKSTSLFRFAATSSSVQQNYEYTAGSRNVNIRSLSYGTKDGDQSITNTGETYQNPVEFKVSWNPSVIKTPELTFTPVLSNIPSGESAPSITAIDRKSDSSSTDFSITMRASSAPLMNYLNLSVTSEYLPPFEGSDKNYNSTVQVEAVLGVKITMDEIKSIPALFDGSIVGDQLVTFSYEPKAFFPTERTLAITQNSLPFLKAPVAITANSGKGSAVISRGANFDFEREYQAQIQFNANGLSGSGGASSNAQVLAFDAPLIESHGGSQDGSGNSSGIFRYLSGSLVAGVTYDIANDRACKGAGVLRFSISKPARITLELRPVEAGVVKDIVWRTLVSEEEYPKGENQIVVLDDEISFGDYQYTLIAEDIANPTKIEKVRGSAHIYLDYTNPIAIGHANMDDIDLFDGHMAFSRSDISLPGRGKPINFVRNYASTNLKHKAMGPGWSHNYDSKIVDSGCFGLTVYGGDGGGQTFVWDDASTRWKAQKGYHGSLVSTAEGYDFYSKDGTRYHYRSYHFGLPNEWYLESITDTNGNTTSLAYDLASGINHKVTTVQSGKHRLHLAYKYQESFAGIGPVLDYVYACKQGKSCDPGDEDKPIGNVLVYMQYVYDDLGRLKSATYNGTADNGVLNPLNARTEQYEYKINSDRDYYTDAGVYIPYTDVERVAISKVIDYRGKSTEYTSKPIEIYANPGILGDTVRIASYDSITKPEDGTTSIGIVGLYQSERFEPGYKVQTTVKNARGFDTVYSHNAYGAPIEIVSPIGSKFMNWDVSTDVLLRSSTDENNVTTRFDYDQNGNLVHEYIEGVANSDIYYSYFWGISDVIPADLKAPAPIFESKLSSGSDLLLIKNRLYRKRDRNGNITTYNYDKRGNLAQITYPEVATLASNLPSHMPKTPKGVFTESFTYDSVTGDKLSHKDRNGNLSYFAYDDYGNILQATQMVSEQIQRSYMRWNEIGLKTAESDARSSGINDTRYLTQYLYDGLQNLRTVLYPETENGVVTTEYTYDLNGNKLSQTDEENKVTSWTYDDQNRVETQTNALLKTRSFTYDPAGNLKTETGYRSGNLTTYSYNGGNQQTGIEGPEDRIVHREFDGVGNLRKEYVTADRLTEYQYDAYNRRHKMIQPNDDVPAGNITDYEYDFNGNLILETGAEPGRITHMIYDEHNRLVERNEPLGRTLGFAYDANGNQLYQVDGNGGVLSREYDALNRIVLEKTPEQNGGTGGALGVAITYNYDKAGNLERMVGRRFQVTTNSYDARNRKLSTTVDAIVDGVAQRLTTDYSYNGVGNVRTESLANGNVIETIYTNLHQVQRRFDLVGDITTHTYDDDGNPQTIIDGENHKTTYTYDLLNRLTHEKLHDEREFVTTYDVYGNVKSKKDGNQNVTTFEYNAVNQLVKTIDPAPFNAQELVFGYDKVGNKILEIDRRGNSTVFEYDVLNRLKSITYPELGTDGNPLKESFTYDFNNNQKTVTDRRGFVTENFYNFNNQVTRINRDGTDILKRRDFDGDNNIIEEVDAQSNISGFTYDPRNLVIRESRPELAITLYHYDSLGQVSKVISPELRITRSEYDLRGRLESVFTPKSSGDGEDETAFTYDLANKQKTKTLARDNVWVYNYDTTNRLESIVAPGNVVTAYTYDDNNNIKTQTDARLKTTTFHYDELNRRTQIDYPDDAVVTYDEYDASGNLKAMTDANGLGVSYSYDKINRETLRTFEVGVDSIAQQVESVVTAYDNNNNVSDVSETYFDNSIAARHYQWQFDHFDRLAFYTDAFGKRLGYLYDLNGNRTQLTDADSKATKYLYDGINRINTVINASGTTRYNYYRDSRLKSVSYPNTISAAYTYDNAGRTQSITNKQNTAVLSQFDYLYDANGNRTQQTEINGAASETTRYSYDDLDRLTDVYYGAQGCPSDVRTLCAFSNADLSVTYGYDDAFNRTSEIHVDASGTTVKNRSYSINSRNQIDTITDVLDAAQNVVYGYDANGNQLSKTQASSTTEFIWDNRDNLRTVTQGGSTVGQFLYDAQGLRTEKLGDRGTERYTYDDQSVLQQTDASGTTIAKYEYGPDRLLSLKHASEGTQFYLTDALNSVVNLANASGAVQARYKYDAWGNKREQVGDSWNRFAFTGYEEDTESGLLYAKARFYDPDTGRFLSQDAWEGEQMTPPSLHKYLYAYGNPTVWWDPSGNNSISIGDPSLQMAMNELIPDKRMRESAQNQQALEMEATAPMAVGMAVQTIKDTASGAIGLAAWYGDVLLGLGGVGSETHYKRALEKSGKFYEGAGAFLSDPGGVLGDAIVNGVQEGARHLENRHYYEAGKSSASLGQLAMAPLAAPSAVRSAMSLTVSGVKKAKSKVFVASEAIDSPSSQIVSEYAGSKPISASIAGDVPDKNFSISVRDGNNSRNVDWFDLDTVVNDMSGSSIGRTVLDAADSNQIRLQFSRSYYRDGLLGPENFNVGGVTFLPSVGQQSATKAKVFLPKVGNNARAAEVAVHEGVHGLGVAGSRRAEVLARAAEVMHRTGSDKVPLSTLKGIYRQVNSTPVYQADPLKIGLQSPLFPGVTF